MAVDLRPLKQFMALAESLHFSRASDACHVSPSTLSRTIKQLEEQLGVSLFVRDNRSVTLTPEGDKFRHYARGALMQWEVIHNDLMSDARELRGSLSMYCSVTASYSFLYDILHQFRPRYPLIAIKLHTGDPELAIHRVLAEQDDVAIAARPDNLPTGLAFKQIALSPLVFIAPVHSLQLGSPLTAPLSAEQWSDNPVIMPEQGVARRRLGQWFQEIGKKPNIYAQVAGNEAIVSMVSLGFGVGVVPEIVLNNSPLSDRVRILSITPDLKPYDVGFCVLETKLKNPLIRAFWSQLPEPS